MKKFLAMTLAALMLLGVLTACGGTATTTPDKTEEPPVEVGNGANLMTGLGVVTSLEKSKEAAEENGVAQADSMIAAVLVDGEGVIRDCKIDSMQSKIEFDATGKLITAMDTVLVSKNALGADYGMGGVSAIGKEWNEQAAAFAEYVIGKTVEEVNGIATEEGKATDADLASSVTVRIGDFQAAIAKAVANAQELGAKEGDTLSLAVTGNISKSKDAGEEEGLAQAYLTIAAVSFNGDIITSSIIDGLQSNVNFTTEGKISTDLTTVPMTKNELGADYGMAGVSSIGKEWNEQAAAFAQYIVGKTAAEVAEIATEEGKATDADLASSVTVRIGDFQSVVEMAAANR